MFLRRGCMPKASSSAGDATGVPATRVNTTEFMGLRVNNGTCRAWQLHVQAYNFHEVHVSEL